MCEFDVQKPRN